MIIEYLWCKTIIILCKETDKTHFLSTENGRNVFKVTQLFHLIISSIKMQVYRKRVL